MLDLRQSLLDYTTEMLVAIAESRGMAAEKPRDDLLQDIAEASLGPLSLHLLWDGLSLAEREALSDLAGKGGWMPAAYFEHEHGRPRDFGPARLLRERLWEHPENACESLLFRGLIFRGFSAGGQSLTWYIPTDLLDQLPAPALASISPKAPRPVAGEVVLSRTASDYLLRAVYHVLVCARSEVSPRVTAVRNRLGLEPDAPDEQRVAYFSRLGHRMALEMGLVQGEHVPPTHVRRAQAWLAKTWSGALDVVIAAWAASEEWHELLEAPGLTYEGGRLPPAAPAREHVLGALRDLDAGAWYRVTDLQEWIRDSDPGFLRSDADFDSLFLRSENDGQALDGLAAWMQVDGRVIEEILVELNALSALSLGASGPLPCFRVEPSAWWLPRAAAEGLPPKPISIGPDLLLTLPAQASPGLRYQVEAVSEWEPSQGRYRITRASLRRVQSRGVSPERVERFLESHGRRFGPLARAHLASLVGPPTARAEDMVALTPEDPEALAAISSDPGMRLLITGAPFQGRVLIPKAKWQAAHARLLTLGFRVQNLAED